LEVGTRFNKWEAAPRGEWRIMERWFRTVVADCNSIIPPSERCGMVDGVPDWLQRIGALGNAVVPAIGELLGSLILKDMKENKCR